MGKRGHGEGTIIENKARGRWEGRITVGYAADGSQIRRKVTAPTRKAVVARLAEASNMAASGQEPARADMTVRRFMNEWVTDVLPGSVAPSTLVQYRDVTRLYIVPLLGQKRLRTLQARDVTMMVRAMAAGTAPMGKPLSPNTCRLARSILRRALRWAEVEGMVSRNVAALANGVKLGQRDGRSLTVDQAKTLLEHLKGDRLEAAYVAALALGLRRGELLGLSWSDIDLDATPAKMTITRNLTRLGGVGLVLSDTKTAGSRRTVHLPVQVVDVLRAHRLRQLEERLLIGSDWPTLPLGADLVFRTEFGTPLDPDNFRQHVYRTTMQAFTPEAERPEPGKAWPTKYRWSPHELRHSAASLLIAQGVPMKMVSDLLGHSSIRMTADVYGHLFDNAGAVAADAMSAALWGTTA